MAPTASPDPEMTAVNPDATPERLVSENFLTDILDRAAQAGVQIVTRFPPEPNGYAHIGHAVASYLELWFSPGLRRVDAVTDGRHESADRKARVRRRLYPRHALARLGVGGAVSYASNYFAEFYEMARTLIRAGKAYVDSVPEEEMAALRGTATTPGTPSPYRERSVEENLELLEKMRLGEFSNGAHVLRAKLT